MTGSALAPVIIPIVALGCLAAWIVMVFYADAHPMHQSRGAARAPQGTVARGEQDTAARGEQADRAREPAPPGQKAA
jgi:hypothetical protein